MCLIVKGDVKKAKENITCYKVISQIFGYGYFTQIAYADISEDILKGVSIFRPYKLQPLSNSKFERNGHIMIGAGAIHSYKNLVAAKHQAKPNFFMDHVWECIIPKGEEYVEGYDDTGRNGYPLEYASSGVKFIREIKLD